MTTLIVAALLVVTLILLLCAGYLGNLPEPAHGHLTRPQQAGKWLRARPGAVRAWWATRCALAPEDRMTVAWLEVVHDDPGGTDSAQATRAAELYHEEMGLGAGFFPDVLPAPVDVPGQETGSAPWPAPAGDTPGAAVLDEAPASGPAAALGAQLPNRGDAQGRDGSRAPSRGTQDVPAAVAWAQAELTGQHLRADTGAFPKVTGVA